MKVLLFLRLPELQFARGRLGREAAGWSRLPLADSMKSPGRVLKSPGRVRLLQSLGRLPNSPCRLLGSSSRIRLLQEEPAQRWNPTLAMA